MYALCCGPGGVHSLFKEYHTCARSFSSPLLPAPLSLSRLAARLKTPLQPQLTLQPKLLLTLRLLPPTLPRVLLPPPPKPLVLLRLLPLPLLALLRTLLLLRPTLLLLLRMPARRCNLRHTAKDWGAEGNLRALFFGLGHARLTDLIVRLTLRRWERIPPTRKSG
jgi:hypothetical protein